MSEVATTTLFGQLLLGLAQSARVFSLWALVDIVVVALVVYVVLLFIRQTKSFFIFSAIVSLVGINYVAATFNLALTRQLFQPLLTFFLVIFVVVFQKEIRRFFDWLTWPGHQRLWQRRAHVPDADFARILVSAAKELATKRIGALIVLSGREPWEQVVQGGFPVEGKLSVPLLLSIFDPTSPGHDGAVLIEDGRLKAFGLHLPLADNFAHFARLGTRHRAAVGMSERTDSLVIVVSEERGVISIAEGGTLTPVNDPDILEQQIDSFIGRDYAPSMSPRQYFITHNFSLKVAALALSVLLWFGVNARTSVVNREFALPLEFQGLSKELVIAETSTTNISVVAAGTNHDMRSLGPSALRAVVNLSGLDAGYHVVALSPSSVSRPTYINVQSVTPSQVWVRISRLGNTPES